VLQSAAHRRSAWSGLDFARHLRKPADALAISTAHADVYLEDDDLGE